MTKKIGMPTLIVLLIAAVLVGAGGMYLIVQSSPATFVTFQNRDTQTQTTTLQATGTDTQEVASNLTVEARLFDVNMLFTNGETGGQMDMVGKFIVDKTHDVALLRDGDLNTLDEAFFGDYDPENPAVPDPDSLRLIFESSLDSNKASIKSQLGVTNVAMHEEFFNGALEQLALGMSGDTNTSRALSARLLAQEGEKCGFWCQMGQAIKDFSSKIKKTGFWGGFLVAVLMMLVI